jgi:hypothetical protein
VARHIVRADVGLGLDDAPDLPLAVDLTDQGRAEQRLRDRDGVPLVE